MNNTVERQIFTSIHELSHILVHDENEEDEEKIVNQIAGYFLVPEEEFKEYWDSLAYLSRYDVINLLKRKYKVSYMTIIHRLIEIGIADTSWYKEHRKEYKARKGKAVAFKNEPIGLKQLDFFPKKLASILSQAISQELISRDEANEILEL